MTIVGVCRAAHRKSWADDKISDSRFALGNCSGFVQQHCGELVRLLQRNAVPEEDSHSSALANADHDGSGCRQPHGAGTGDHKNGD